MVQELTTAINLKDSVWEPIIFAMMAGKLQEDPYTAEQRTAGANYMNAWVRQKGFHPTATKEDIPQGPRI